MLGENALLTNNQEVLDSVKSTIRKFVEMEEQFVINLEKETKTASKQNISLMIHLCELHESNTKILRDMLLKLDTIQLWQGV